MPGHVFVMHGDLTRLACDDLLIPCDAALNISRAWAPLVQPRLGGSGWFQIPGLQPPDGFTEERRPPLLLPSRDDQRRRWLVNTAHGAGNVKWLVSGIEAALGRVTQYPDETPLQRRARRLVGLPLVGVGEGGYEGIQGDVIDRLVEVLDDHVRGPAAPDIALVLHRRSDFAAVQSRRQPKFPGLNDHHLALAKQLSGRVRNDEVVLFMGSGVSAAAGYPTWRQLLNQLLEKAQIAEDEAAAVLNLPSPDAAEVIGAALGEKSLHEEIASIMAARPYALAHGLLASLRVPESLTTNYDTLYEDAAATAHVKPPKVLPRERAEPNRSWLLKLHGDVERPESIVLTREHYLDFDSTRGPLGAMVQAQMLTKHLLFLGYSLSDDNVLKLTRQVRRLFKTSGVDSTTGTVVSLFADRGRERLWGEDLSFHPMVDGPYDADRLAEAARNFEIFMDALVHHAAQNEKSYILDHRYRALLTPAERAFVDATGEWLNRLGPEAKGTEGFRRTYAVLRELGHRGPCR